MDEIAPRNIRFIKIFMVMPVQTNKIELSQRCCIPPHSALSQNRCHVIEKKNHGSALTG